MANPNTKNFYLPTTRKHVLKGAEWGHTAGTDYWLNFNSNFDILAAASTATGDELAENGWTSTSLVNTAGSGSDFRGGVLTQVGSSGPHPPKYAGTYADLGIPNHALTNASGDLLLSPAIWGDAVHMEQAAILAGKSTLPQYLVCDFWGSMSVATAAEVRSSWGLFVAAATDATVEASQLAVIQSGGTGANMLLAGAAATMAQGPAIGTGWAKWRILLQFNGATGANVFAYKDGTIFSTTAGVAAQDVFPCRFGFGAFTTNRPLLGATHIYYAW